MKSSRRGAETQREKAYLVFTEYVFADIHIQIQQRPDIFS